MNRLLLNQVEQLSGNDVIVLSLLGGAAASEFLLRYWKGCISIRLCILIKFNLLAGNDVIVLSPLGVLQMILITELDRVNPILYSFLRVATRLLRTVYDIIKLIVNHK
jgi:hypothetical protein